MSYISYIKQPALIQEPATCVINFDETEVTVTDPQTKEERKAYTYESIRVAKSDYNYSGLINAIVRYKYTQSQVEAIILNGSDTEEHAQKLTELQAWRTHAKEIAKQVLGID